MLPAGNPIRRLTRNVP